MPTDYNILLKAYRGMTVELFTRFIAIFVDDFTGTTLNRPEFLKALDKLRTGEARAIISYDSDRLSRNPTDYVILRDECLSLGVELHYVVRGKIDLADFGHMVLEDIWMLKRKVNILFWILTPETRLNTSASTMNSTVSRMLF